MTLFACSPLAGGQIDGEQVDAESGVVSVVTRDDTLLL